MEIIPVNYDTGSLTNDLVNMVSEKAREKGLQLKVEIDSALPAVLYGDDVRVRQVITNLLTNAVKYTEKGTVTLRIQGKEREQNSEKIILHVEIEDTGIGIHEEDMAKLFHSFERLDQERNHSIEGTGLGIPIVQTLLQMMGSKLEVKSKYAEGSLFWFDLEQTVVSEEVLGDFQAYHRERRKEQNQYVYAPEARVLLIDDSSVNLQVAAGLLKRNGVKIDTAIGGSEGIELAEKNHYDIIFVDHMMPGMDGITTLKTLRTNGILPACTPVIMMTANAIVGAREEYLREGFTDYLSKPIIVAQLEEKLKKYLPEDKILYREAGKPEPEMTIEEASPESAGTAELMTEIDTAAGLMYCGDSEELYLEILGEYVASQMADELNRCWQKKDWGNYRIQVHSLKGTSRAVGALAFSEQALQMETALKEERYDLAVEHHAELIKNYEMLLANIERYLQAKGVAQV